MRRDEVKVSEIVPMMSPEPREDWVIRQAREKPPAERAAFLEGACPCDEAMRRRLENLLAALQQTAGTLVDLPTASEILKADFADRPDEAAGQTLGRYSGRSGHWLYGGVVFSGWEHDNLGQPQCCAVRLERPSWEEIPTAEAKEKTETRGP
jgi:hypothetical protein